MKNKTCVSPEHKAVAVEPGHVKNIKKINKDKTL